LKLSVKARVRCAGVAIAICSWFAISNHCVFAALATRGVGCKPASIHRHDADTSECPFHSKPGKKKEQSSHVQCCKILRAVVFAKAKSWARDDTKFSDADLRFERFVFIALLRNAQVSLSLDTGPPDPHSFAELILQRSLFAHAPPSLI
jgi:hypothetical protein